MRVYISGKITGLPYDEVVRLFAKGEDDISKMGHEPINPLNNGLVKSATWKEHMVRDIEMLMTCEAIYLLTNWTDSRGARIERGVGFEMGLEVILEGGSISLRAERIKYAIEMATGFCFDDYTTKSRNRELYYARMAFICLSEPFYKVSELGEMVNRDHSTVIHCLTNFQSEKQYNKEFRNMINKIEKLLTISVSY